MNYQKIYSDLCNRGKTRKKTKGSNLERHHIIPTFFFKNPKREKRYNDGIYDGDGEHVGNITYLTPREHFIAHLVLCKMWRGTKWEYRCFTSCKMFLIGGENNESRDVFRQNSRLVEKYKIEVNAGLSKGKTGTMPAKDATTGERLGIVATNHPKVISGEWVHITKGIKKTEEQKRRIEPKCGYTNSNSKYSDSDLLLSYKQCCYAYGMIVSATFWVDYAEYKNLPHIKHWKSFRFNNKGFNGMVEAAIRIAETENVAIQKNIDYKSYEWRSFAKKEKKKWV